MTERRLTPDELDRLPFINCPDCGHRIHVDIEGIRADERARVAVAIEAEATQWEHNIGLMNRLIGPTIRTVFMHAAEIARKGSR